MTENACALWDLTGRGTIAAAGKDRAELLHGMLTNDIRKLRPGEGCHAALLTPKGKMRAEANVLCREDRILLDTPPELAASLAPLLQGYVFFQDATFTDETAAHAVLHVAGPRAADVLHAAGVATLPDSPHAHVAGTVAGRPALVVREARARAAGWDVRVSSADRETVARALVAAGATRSTREDLEAERIEAGLPRWGAELTEDVLPNEAFLERTAISYTKGCYVGQEIVARIRTYGHVNRSLVRLVLPADANVAAGAEVRAGDAKAGAVTSAAASPARPNVVALAYVKRDLAAAGTGLAVVTADGSVPASVEPLGS